MRSNRSPAGSGMTAPRLSIAAVGAFSLALMHLWWRAATAGYRVHIAERFVYGADPRGGDLLHRFRWRNARGEPWCARWPPLSRA